MKQRMYCMNAPENVAWCPGPGSGVRRFPHYRRLITLRILDWLPEPMKNAWTYHRSLPKIAVLYRRVDGVAPLVIMP